MFYREFILGDNPSGLVLPDGSVVGGEDPSLFQGDVLPGQREIMYFDPDNPTVTSTYVYPLETISAWNCFFSSVVASSSAAEATAATGVSA